MNGKQYYQNGVLQKTGWTVIDGNTYYLDTETGYAATGITTLVPNGATEEARCVFDANGVFQSNVTGVYSVGADTYWLNSGIIEEEAGLKRVVKENGEVNYYYFAVQKNLEEREGLTLSAAVKSTVLNGRIAGSTRPMALRFLNGATTSMRTVSFCTTRTPARTES